MSVKVSIIISVHNDEKNLKTALDSIKSQTFKQYEVLMIDADSTDSSAEIMKSYCTDKRFQYHRVDKYSFSLARNYGISIAKGKYIAFGDASVIFTKDLIEDMYQKAEKEDADLCVAPMASSDIYGKHIFKSSGILSGRKKTDKFDTELIWNPSVTNKLFKTERIKQLGLEFSAFGKAREAAFTLPFAFESSVIVCSSKGAASYVIPVMNSGVAEFPIEHYLDAYEFILERAHEAFNKSFESCVSDFDRKELKKVSVCYIDELILKEITVLLYSYYRHFWSLEDVEIKRYVDILNQLISKLSGAGRKRLLSMNKDLFYDGRLIDNKAEMAENPRVTVCIGKSEKRGHLHEKRLEIQVSSVFEQTMPCFELLVDSRLRDIFPKKWIDFPNVRFIEAQSLADFKDTALSECRTKYIMYQDGFARLNPKILMRHYTAHQSGEKYGFTTSPLTKFDGQKTSEYSFSDLSFYSSMDAARVEPGDSMFALDLFFCNKLFRTDHLNGIHFSFSDNPVRDMYKLYEHSKFKKLYHRGAYLPYTEEEALKLLKDEQDCLPPDCKALYRKYKSVYFTAVTLKNRKRKITDSIGRLKRLVINLIGRILVFFFGKMHIKNRVFFYTIRSNGTLLENIDYVYKACDCKKVVFAKMLPHSLKDILKVKYYMLTSKVLVTDDYFKYLRNIRLRPEQKLVQLWHACGAFKRFGLDAPSKLTRIEEFNTHSQYDVVCVSSEYVRQFYAHAFGVDLDVIKPIGSPRTDGLIDNQNIRNQKDLIVTKHPLLKNKKVYVYLPTFRESYGSVVDFDPCIDWSKLNDDLDDDEVFIVGRHPVMKKEFFSTHIYSRVKDYTFESTTELLSVADVVITDYSSVIFDAALLNRPLVFYCPDYDTNERDFYLDYEKDLPGEIIYDNERLLEAVRNAHVDYDTEAMQQFKEKELGACDGHSTERVAGIVMKLLSE